MSKKNEQKIDRIEYVRKNGEEGKPFYEFRVFTDINEINKISGHRFVKLALKDDWMRNDLDVLLQFLSARPYIENIYTRVGKKLEPELIKLVSQYYPMSDIKTFDNYDDLKLGTEDFHFIRDLMYKDETNDPVIGEIKTFHNKQKIGLTKKNPFPPPHISWWLQTRLELDILGDVGDKARIFYYYVDKTLREAVDEGRPYSLKTKNLYASDYIIKPEIGEEEAIIKENFKDYGIKDFETLKEFVKDERDELMTMYENNDGETFYVCYAQITYPHYLLKNFNHIENFLDEISEYFDIYEMED